MGILTIPPVTCAQMKVQGLCPGQGLRSRFLNPHGELTLWVLCPGLQTRPLFNSLQLANISFSHFIAYPLKHCAHKGTAENYPLVFQGQQRAPKTHGCLLKLRTRLDDDGHHRENVSLVAVYDICSEVVIHKLGWAVRKKRTEGQRFISKRTS